MTVSENATNDFVSDSNHEERANISISSSASDPISGLNPASSDKESQCSAKKPEDALSNDFSNILSLDYKKVVDITKILKSFKHDSPKIDEYANLKHAFWDTQLVPKMHESISSSEFGAIDDTNNVETVRKSPYKLPEGFYWSDFDINDSKQLDEVYELLYGHYVEDDDNMFRFDYSRELLRWSLTPPGYMSDWHCLVRVEKNNKLVGFITGIPAKIHVCGKEIDVAEINFLCIHVKLRSKRLAPVLIKEVTRRVNLKGRWQAVYTAGIILPKPLSQCRYWHRPLNPKKLLEVGFSSLGLRMTVKRSIMLYKVDEKPRLPGVRVMQPEDVPAVHLLLKKNFENYKFHIIFSEEECRHWLLPRDGVIYSYVNVNACGEVVDFLSFYCLQSTVIKNEKHSSIKAAYSYYNVATSVSLKELISDALIFAKIEGFDVYNALDIMDNSSIFKDLKFGIGDGLLRYYLYNWRCPELKSSDLCLVLI